MTGLALATLYATAVATTSGTPAVESPWTWSVNEEGVVRSWNDDPDTARREDVVDGINRLIGVVTRGPFEANAQLDIAFAHPAERAGLTTEATVPPPGATTSLLLEDDGGELEYGVVFEKKVLRYSGSRATVELGDTYRAVGRGLALALVKNTELDIDTSLEGAAADLRLGSFEASAFGGWSNPQTVSAAFSNHLRRDPRDLIAGGRAAWSGPLEVFAHGLVFRFDEEAQRQIVFERELFLPERASAAGGGFSFPDLFSGLADVYVEGLAMTIEGTDEDLEDVAHDGYGGYAAANLYLGPLTLAMEGKSYRNLELLNVRSGEGSPYDYSTPPTLEKENVVTFNVAEAVNSNDIHGGKASLSFPVGGGFLGRVSYLRLVDLGHDSDTSLGKIDGNESIHHGYASVERRSEGFFFQMTAGARRETRLSDPDINEDLIHLDGDLLIPISSSMSVELKGLGYRQTEKSAQTGYERTNDTNSFVLSVRPLRWASIAALIDTTTDARVTTGFGAQPGNISEQAFGAVEITVEPTEQSTARLFAGATQGGLKCSGGTCRVVPAFEGVRVEWLARF